jgi:DNA-binding XRE family transcriptional regulator
MDHNRSTSIRRNRVRELRENRLMTQAQLARKAKVALRTIHSVEKGMNCRMDTKRKILLALGMRFEDKDHVFPPAAAFDLGHGHGHGQGGEHSPVF